MPDRTIVPRAGSTLLPPLQRIKTGSQSVKQIPQFYRLFREARQDHSPMFYSSAPSSGKPDRTTVPRACSTLLPPLQRIETRSQSVKHVLQFCRLFREARQDHSPMFYSSASSSEKPDRTTVPCSTVLPPLQRSQTGPQSHVLQFCRLFREARQDHSPMFYSSAASSEKPGRTTVPRARSTVMSPSFENQDRI